jgi:RNA-directed DNA polymerase
VDGTTWEAYGQNLETNLHDLHGKLSRRVYIPKADRRQLPFGVLEATQSDAALARLDALRTATMSAGT